MTTELKKNHALILRTDGEFEIIDWPADGHLAILYRAIDCRNVDAVDISTTLTMWVDDEGLINGAPVNHGATILYALHKEPHQHYHGTTVITGGTGRHGETLGLSKDEIASLVEFHLTFIPLRIPGQRDRRAS
ncbi:DUF3846 domain-containing protein [Streptomyces sp. NPDC048211]|uniref:DUF3846 domain-containing protein n=1 Tax=Streptomyces sp. NPDC048211 TaxID=3365516 RepID=UPI003721E664